MKKKRETKQLIYEDLINKYSEKNYQTKNLYINDNLFDKSILLQNNKYENVLILDNNNEEYNKSKQYIYKLQDLLNTDKKKNDPFQFNTSLKLNDQENKNIENYYPYNYNFKKNILLLKYDILKTKKTIDETLSPEPIFSDRTISNLSIYNPTKSNSETQIKFNTTIDTNYTNKNNNFNDKNLKKKILLPKQLLNINKVKSVDFDANSNFDKQLIFKSIISSNDISSRNKSEIKMTPDMKKKIHEDMMNNLSDLYERIKKTNFEESENNILEYCFKYDKKIPEKEK